jgi:hypothetical protein
MKQFTVAETHVVIIICILNKIEDSIKDAMMIVKNAIPRSTHEINAIQQQTGGTIEMG